MNEQELSQRLTRVAENVSLNARLADIGSDHGYLPASLMLKEKITFAVAGEVVKGPYESAKKQVQKCGLSDKIAVRLADGLDAVKPEDRVDNITIAGMGGTLIRSILENGKQKQRINGSERLILQPNVGEKNLRDWLVSNNYKIVHEEILEENRKIYEIIVAEHGVADYSEQELFFGPFLLKEKNSVFQKKWRQELKQRQKVAEQLQKAEQPPKEKVAEVLQQIQWIEEVLQ